MFDMKKYKIPSIGILMCMLIIILTSVVTAQEAQPYQYARPYQNAFNHDRRRFNVPNSGSSGFASDNGDLIKFPDDSLIRGSSDGYSFNDRHKKDYSRNADCCGHSQRSVEDSYIPMNVTNGINSYDDFFNLLDENSRGQIETISPRFHGLNVERSQGSRPVPANCVPEMTVVPLKLADESDVKDPTIVVFPSCTRVKRCGGCCNNNLVTCQAMESNSIVYEVYKSQYQNGGRIKFLNKELVEVEEHTKCKCDCRKKESDCTKFQRYNKAQCVCICINIEDRNKCLTEGGEKLWDSDTCTCRCRETKECSTGSYFDSNTCSCQETPGYQDMQTISDRRRLIKKPVIIVPESNGPYYNSGT